MKPIQNAAGNVGLMARPYPIAYNTNISEGMVVKLSGGLVVAAVAAETGPILGIAAEMHTGSTDPLNLRNNGTEILVYDNPELLFDCPAPKFAAASGSATTIVPKSGDVDADAADDSFNGSILQLVELGASSSNTDPIGKRITVTDYAKSGTVITKASGGTPSAGDVYEVYPVIGAAVGGIAGLDTSISKLGLATAGATKIKCVGHDYARHTVRLMAVEHSMGVEN